MNQTVMDYVKKVVESYPVSGSVLEVGSMNVNGTPRTIFSDRKRFSRYIGVDMRPGPGVDQVMRSDALEMPDRSVDCLICCEMLEHDTRPWESVREFFRVLRPSGFAVITTCAFARQRHDYPEDYWRFTDTGLRELIASAGFEAREIEISMDGFGVMGVFQRMAEP